MCCVCHITRALTKQVMAVGAVCACAYLFYLFEQYANNILVISVIETAQMIEGSKYFYRGPLAACRLHVSQLCSGV